MSDIITKHISSLTTTDNTTYTITINKKTKTVTCTCLGFQGYGRCKHIRIFKDMITKNLYNTEYIHNTIQNFKNCSELIQQLIDHNPMLMYSYNDLVEEVHKHRKYSCETITRSYRKLKEQELITEPDDLSIKREATEHVMNDINKWSPEIVLRGQSKLI